MHLCRITPPEQHEELDVEVGFLLRSWEIHHLHALRDSTRRNLTRQILNEVPNDAYKMFIGFLRGAAEPEVFSADSPLRPLSTSSILSPFIRQAGARTV